MSSIIADDLRSQYDKIFATVRGILDTFPDENWMQPHGDEYYIPSRIAYHVVEFIDGAVAGRFTDPGFRDNLPFGPWHTGTPETLPSRSALISYFEEAIGRAKSALAGIDDDILTSPTPPEMARMGALGMSLHIMAVREISAHTGELNKMLVENGKDDVWVSR